MLNNHAVNLVLKEPDLTDQMADIFWSAQCFQVSLKTSLSIYVVGKFFIQIKMLIIIYYYESASCYFQSNNNIALLWKYKRRLRVSTFISELVKWKWLASLEDCYLIF